MKNLLKRFQPERTMTVTLKLEGHIEGGTERQFRKLDDWLQTAGKDLNGHVKDVMMRYSYSYMPPDLQDSWDFRVEVCPSREPPRPDRGPASPSPSTPEEIDFDR
ncbi:hypothetical protein KHC28_01485 [Ancylobacter sonchi]|uniref:hypothetical protein n=1 Tax=Ancylobacter sonchi TaxID=1937790 RepID=UPI001BD29739|nr:hypothetical protein [Ancylobacter sonchi]MBS7532325.1 hypothetical protein [Ancylobacter sonchi]